MCCWSAHAAPHSAKPSSSCSGDALAAYTLCGSVGRPRWLRILSIADGFMMNASSRRGPPQCGQVSTSSPLQRLVGPFTSIGTVVQATSSLSPNGSLFQKTRIAHITHPVTSMVTRPVLNRRCPAAGKRTDLDLFTIFPNKNDSSDSKTIIIGGNIKAGKSLPSILEDMSSRKE